MFIVNGGQYEDFIKESIKYGLEENRFYIFMDTKNSFIHGNNNIPKRIINSSVLINKKNQILLIGSPFSTPEMKRIFHNICSN